MVRRAHQQHPAHNISRGDTLSTWDGQVFALVDRRLVDVLAINYTRVVSVHNEIDTILSKDKVHVFVIHDVRDASNDFIHEFAAWN